MCFEGTAQNHGKSVEGGDLQEGTPKRVKWFAHFLRMAELGLVVVERSSRSAYATPTQTFQDTCEGRGIRNGTKRMTFSNQAYYKLQVIVSKSAMQRRCLKLARAKASPPALTLGRHAPAARTLPHLHRFQLDARSYLLHKNTFSSPHPLLLGLVNSFSPISCYFAHSVVLLNL